MLVRGRGIDEEQLAVAHRPVVLHVVQDRGVGSGPDDAAVSRPVAAEPPEPSLEQRLDLVLAASRSRGLHRLRVSPCADLRRLLEQRDLSRGLASAETGNGFVERVGHQPWMRLPELRQEAEPRGQRVLGRIVAGLDIGHDVEGEVAARERIDRTP